MKTFFGSILKKATEKPLQALGSIGKLVVYACISPLSYIVRKRKGLLLFFPSHDKNRMSGNLRQTYLYLLENHPEVNCLWITENRKVFNEMRAESLPVIIYRFFPWQIFRSEYILIDSINWKLAFGRFKLIQLWHGVGYKHVGLANPNRGQLELFLMKKHFRKYVLITASSQADKNFLEKCFENQNVVVTGTPRNDVFFSSTENPNEDWLLGYSKIVLYAPTFRDNLGSPPFGESFWAVLQSWAQKNKVAVLIKKHPRDQTLNVPGNFENIIDVTNRSIDLQKILQIADILITDYSSIATDFSLSGKPIVFYTYDFDAYLSSSRSSYYDLKKVLPGPFADDEKMLLALLADPSWFNDRGYKEKYDEFRDKFHQYKDAYSVGRVAAAIARLR